VPHNPSQSRPGHVARVKVPSNAYQRSHTCGLLHALQQDRPLTSGQGRAYANLDKVGSIGAQRQQHFPTVKATPQNRQEERTAHLEEQPGGHLSFANKKTLARRHVV